MKNIYLLFFLVFYHAGRLWAHHEIQFEQLDSEQQQIHATLYKQASIERNDHTRDGRNFLSAALRFQLSDGTSSTFYIRNPRTKAFFFVSGKEKSSFTTKAQQLHEKLKNGFDSPKLLYHTSSQMEQNRYSLWDSEMKLISALTFPECEPLIRLLRSSVNLGKIESIECHVFTTRDMCPCCYQHMQNFLNAINFMEDDSIFSVIKPHRDIPVTFFISSIVGFRSNQESINFLNSNYQYCLSEETLLIPHTIEAGKMHCVFLRETPHTEIMVESANTGNCIPQLNPKFQKQLFFLMLEPDQSIKYHCPFGRESLMEKDRKQRQVRERNRARDRKKESFFAG